MSLKLFITIYFFWNDFRKKSTDGGPVKLNADKLIEVEKAETGSVKWLVYKHYLLSIGLFLSFATIILNVIFQGFSIGSNLWLSAWSSDPSLTRIINDTIVVDTGKRDLYLGVYAGLGVGQGKYCLIGFF